MEKILTVSIAAYNVENYLRRTLESLVRYSDDERLEVIIVDDGSSDNTSEISQEFSVNYPQVFKLIKKENGGYGSTINASLKEATGKYFKLLDGDDWFQKDILDNYLDFLERTDSDIVLAPYTIAYMPDGEMELKDVHNELNQFKEDIARGKIKNSITHQELAVKTKILQENGVFITEHCFYTDQEFVFQSILFSNSITKFGMPVYCYQVGREGQSVSINGLKKHYKDAMKVADNLYNMYSRHLKTIYEGKNRILLIKLVLSTALVFRANIVRSDITNAKNELREFDQNMKSKYPEIYNITNNVRTIRLLRIMHFKMFGLCRMLYIGMKTKIIG